jgi:hypothetical protein
MKVKDLAPTLFYEIKNSAWNILEQAGVWDSECSTKAEAIEKVKSYLELWRIANIDTAIHICEQMEETFYTVALTRRQHEAVSSIGRSTYLCGTELTIGEVIDLEDRLRTAVIATYE